MAKYKKGKLKATETHADIFEKLGGGSGGGIKKLKIKNPFDKFVKKLDPKTREKLKILFQDPSKKVIPIKKIGKKSTNKKILHGYGDKLKIEASRTDPNFKKLSPKAQQRYLEFMHKQIKFNQPMSAKQLQILKDTAPGGKYNVDKVGGWLGKNLSFSDKLTKDYIQIRRLKVIKEELRKLNREEKAAGRLGEKQRTIIQGIKKPPRGK